MRALLYSTRHIETGCCHDLSVSSLNQALLLIASAVPRYFVVSHSQVLHLFADAQSPSDSFYKLSDFGESLSPVVADLPLIGYFVSFASRLVCSNHGTDHHSSRITARLELLILYFSSELHMEAHLTASAFFGVYEFVVAALLTPSLHL